MKNVYFLSDAHLGSRAIAHGRTQERRLVNFLDSIKHNAAAVYLLGDIFDFWYEFKLVVPKGYTRFLGKISEAGCPPSRKGKSLPSAVYWACGRPRPSTPSTTSPWRCSPVPSAAS